MSEQTEHPSFGEKMGQTLHDVLPFIDVVGKKAAQIDQYGGNLTHSEKTEELVYDNEDRSPRRILDAIIEYSKRNGVTKLEAEIRINQLKEDETIEHYTRNMGIGKFNYTVRMQMVSGDNKVVYHDFNFGDRGGSLKSGQSPIADYPTLRTYFTTGMLLIEAKNRFHGLETRLTSSSPNVDLTSESYKEALIHAHRGYTLWDWDHTPETSSTTA